MKKKNKKIEFLCDLDCILVNMLPKWLELYNISSGENVQVKDITEYELRNFCSKPQILDKILATRYFFYNLEPMPGAVKWFKKILELEHVETVIVTQPPRRSQWAFNEKGDWMKKYFPDFELANMIFAHKKYLLHGDVLFDDKPEHLVEWKRRNPKGITAKIKYLYNKDCETDLAFDKRNAWKKFYEYLASLS